MRWTVHGERPIYTSDWMGMALVDVELPSGARFEHHVLRMPAGAAGVVVDDPERGVLLLWRHRFITDSWGWEVPAGRIDAGETPIEAAEREVVEETGWRPTGLRPLTAYFPQNGTADTVFHAFAASGAEHVGDPTDPDEAERIEWLPWARVLEEIRAGRVREGITLTGLLWVAALERA